MRFLSVVHSAMSVSHSANALLVRRGTFNPVNFVHAQNLARTPPEKSARWMYGSYALTFVLFGILAFLVLYLTSSHPLMSGRPDSRPDYYLTCNRSTGGVSDTDRMVSGRLLTTNAWRLTNNGCETVVHGTKLMTHLAKLPATPILNCGNLIIANYLIMIFICKPFQKFHFKLP